MIKNKLIADRKEKNMTQNDMADRPGLSQSQYRRKEHEEIHIFDPEWIRIANYLGKDVQDIKEEIGRIKP